VEKTRGGDQKMHIVGTKEKKREINVKKSETTECCKSLAQRGFGKVTFKVKTAKNGGKGSGIHTQVRGESMTLDQTIDEETPSWPPGGGVRRT